MENTAKQINYEILQAKKILIIPHRNPDGDALGSISALVEYLNSRDIEPEIFCVTEVQNKYYFLPHLHLIKNDPLIFTDPDIDLIIVVDTGDLSHAGVDQYLKNHPAKIINIDHHVTNPRYGHLNMIFPDASATTEVLYSFFRFNSIPVDHQIATSLLTGLISDTENFTNGATTSSSMSVASELVRYGANYKLINNWLLKNKTLNILRLWGTALSRLKKHPEVDLVYTYLLQEDFKKYEVEENESDGIANFLNKLDGAKISLIMKETAEKKIKGSFRTTFNDTDVAVLAKKLGGGGHKKASGFTYDGTKDDVLKKIEEIHKN
ncbi:MAG TPA: bifunctional oligoribonuclease/PAP phosphatase NrnA [Candidatus Magasanikbacteria bacterium]|nr:bifunctional oligoribonuclease/PAP phosphatase NrnA [Candidatus Magasanikbacteria bacterium]